MKKNILLSLIIAGSLSACNKSDGPDVNLPANKVDTLPGTISADLALDATTAYVIAGQVYVKNNATLTIPAGVTVSVVKNDARENKGVLVIAQGAKLIINGTADKPVVFTSAAASKAPGDWGGIFVLGKAPLNTPVAQVAGLAASEDTKFGGTAADDNSGAISYLRMEYCGGINPDNEDEWLLDKASGLSLQAVGSGTRIDHIMVSHSRDDAFQFVGGTVNVSHLIAYNNEDDDFDFDHGYTGKMQFIISYRTGLTSNHALRANSFEPYNDSIPTSNAPLTRPIVSNMTIIGPQGTETSPTGLNQGVYIRKGTRFVMQNSIIAEYPQGALMVCPKTRPVLLNNTGSEFKYNLVHSDSLNRTFSFDKGGDPKGQYGVFADPELRDFAINTVNKNELITSSADLKLTRMYDAAGGPDLRPQAGSVAASGANFEGNNFTSFFTPVTYRGAVGDTNWAAAGNWAVWK